MDGTIGSRTSTAAELAVDALATEGVTRVFGVPGEETLDLVDALRRRRIELVVTRSEQAAGFMAATVGRLTGRAGVALATLGPGATNLVTAAAYASLGGFPLVLLTGQKPLRGVGQGRFQTVDVPAVFRPVTKLARTLVSPDEVPARVRAAFRSAEEERPGAVLLELPDDVARERATSYVSPKARESGAPPLVSAEDLERARRLIASSSRPVLLVAEGASRGGDTTRALEAFLARTGMPFATTQMGKGVVDESSPRWLGTTALSRGDAVHAALALADLIVVVGHDTNEKPPFVVEEGGPRVLHIAASPAGGDAVYGPDLEVVGGIADALRRLAEALAPRAIDRTFDPLRDALREHLDAEASDERLPVHPPRLVAEVRRAMPDDGVVCLDNGMYKLWFARSYRARLPRTLLLDNALATMGAGLPSAIAAKLVDPSKKVLAVVGDGGLMMSLQELETAVRLGVDLVVLVVRDDAYGMIRWKQAEMELPDHGMTFENPDFVALAAAFGAHGHRPDRASDLGPLLAQAIAARGVHLVDVPIDYEANHRILGEELRALGNALRRLPGGRP